jgi:hypothetical protein
MRKITIDYSGSFVKTTDYFARIILFLGIIASSVLIFIEDYPQRFVVIAVIFSSAFSFFLFFIAVSKILEHLMYLRKIREAELFDSGCEIKVVNKN